MLQEPTDLAAMAEALSRSADYRVLRRLVPRPASHPTIGQDCRTGILLDTETTGLDHTADEIIELGMVKFDYTPEVAFLRTEIYMREFEPRLQKLTASLGRRIGLHRPVARLLQHHRDQGAKAEACTDDDAPAQTDLSVARWRAAPAPGRCARGHRSSL